MGPFLEQKWVKSHGSYQKCHQEQGNVSHKNVEAVVGEREAAS